MNWVGDPNQTGRLRAPGDLVEELGLTARLPPWKWRCQRNQLAWESGNHHVHYLGAEYLVGISWSWGPQKPPNSPLQCYLSGRFLSHWAGKLALSLRGIWENLAGRKVSKLAWQARSHQSLGERWWLTENQLKGACFRMMFYIWKNQHILR